ncbi:MAG: flagellar hook-associated protein FlgK, partial [Acidobacteriota bacterium]|nr:flagellar hook-associated protein FlgK [Acidobacteriota bacterium]
NIATGALQANQSAISTISNNVANANTPGYSRETPNLTDNPPIYLGNISNGTGVTYTGATTVRDRVLEQRLAQQQQLASSTDTRLTALNSIQSLFAPSSGASSSSGGDIGTDLTSFFNSFASLEANPTSNALQQQVLSSATTLAGDVSNAAASLNAQQTGLDQQAAGVVNQVNSLTASIAQLNQQIQGLPPGADTSTLDDQRQQDISQLSQLIGINQIRTENNGLSITTTSGQVLVSQAANFQLSTGTSGGLTHFYINGSDVTAKLASGGGQLGGYLMARDQDIPNALASLDQLAYNISTAVNTQNNAGTDLAGDNGNAGNLFSQPTQVTGSALSFSVALTDPNHIAAAGLGAGTGDNSNAVAFANLANQAFVSGQSPINYFSNFVSNLGSRVSQVQTENNAQTASVTQLQNLRDSLSGVNLNEEAASLQQFQRAYQAASQVFNILNTLMANVINLGQQTAVS